MGGPNLALDGCEKMMRLRVNTTDITIDVPRTIGTLASPRRANETIMGKPTIETPISAE